MHARGRVAADIAIVAGDGEKLRFRIDFAQIVAMLDPELFQGLQARLDRRHAGRLGQAQRQGFQLRQHRLADHGQFGDDMSILEPGAAHVAARLQVHADRMAATLRAAGDTVLAEQRSMAQAVQRDPSPTYLGDATAYVDQVVARAKERP